MVRQVCVCVFFCVCYVPSTNVLFLLAKSGRFSEGRWFRLVPTRSNWLFEGLKRGLKVEGWVGMFRLRGWGMHSVCGSPHKDGSKGCVCVCVTLFTHTCWDGWRWCDVWYWSALHGSITRMMMSFTGGKKGGKVCFLYVCKFFGVWDI